nr:polymorphic toxin type 15 domain-containing protein [Clostridium acetobutylicum]
MRTVLSEGKGAIGDLTKSVVVSSAKSAKNIINLQGRTLDDVKKEAGFVNGKLLPASGEAVKSFGKVLKNTGKDLKGLTRQVEVEMPGVGRVSVGPHIEFSEVVKNFKNGVGDIKDNFVKAVKSGDKGAVKAEQSISKIDEVEVKFNYKTKYDEDEFARQLADQEAGMNKLTVDEYLKNRERYIEEGRAIEGNMAQQAARDKALADKVDELRSSGMSLKEAETQAQNWLDTQAALHNPDQIAGGNPLNIGGMGDKGINSSIGAQWKYRIDAVDEQIQSMAKNMTDAERKSNYLNVKLTY